MPKSNIPEHPLFPFEDGEEEKEIAFIQVIRHEDGRSKQVPRMFRAEELRSLQDIFNLFGGGMYELWGRGRSISNPESCGRIAANRRYEIAGLSKPLVDDGSNAPAVKPPIAPSYVPPLAPVAGVGVGDTSVMGMFMQMQMAMMQQAAETARQQAEAQRRADERARADSQQMMQMIATMNASSTQSMMGVVTAMISTAKGGGGAGEMAQYVDLFKNMGLIAKPEGVAEEAGGGVGEIISNLADIVQGAVQLKEGGGLLGGAPPAPGSAAALMGTSPFKIPPQGGQVPPVAT